MNGDYYGHSFESTGQDMPTGRSLYFYFRLCLQVFGTAQDFLVMRMIQAGFPLFPSSAAAYREALKDYSSLDLEAGLAAGIFMALNPRMVAYTNHLYVETVFITIYLAAIYYALRYFKSEMSLKLKAAKGFVPIKYLFLFSLFLGLGNLTRPVLLLLPAVMFVSSLFYIAAKRLDIRRGIRVITADVTFVLFIMLAVFSPWIARNYAVTGRLILIDTNGPINFYIAHNPHATEPGWMSKNQSDMYRLHITGYKEGLVYISKNIGREIELLKTKQQLFCIMEIIISPKLKRIFQNLQASPTEALSRWA